MNTNRTFDYDYLIIGITLILSMIANITHLVISYKMVGDPGLSTAHIYGMILVFDLGVLVLALYGQTWACSIMALIVFIINSCAFLFPQGEFVGLSIKIVPGILFAAVPSYLVYFLSELISNKRERAEEEQRVFVSIEERQRLKHELAETQAQLAALKAPPMPIQSLEAAPLLPTSSLPASYPQGFSKQMQVDNNIQDSELPEQGTMLPGEQIQPKESGRMWSIEGKSKRARKNKYQRWQADIQAGRPINGSRDDFLSLQEEFGAPLNGKKLDRVSA